MSLMIHIFFNLAVACNDLNENIMNELTYLFISYSILCM